MEKARSLPEAEPNLDEIDDGLHPSGFVPASASESGFSPTGTGHGGPSGSPKSPNGTASVDSSAVGPPGLPSGDRLVDSLQGALGAASRSEAGLGSLQRAIRDASRAFTASRQAQEALTEELRVMHRGLNELMSEKAAVERYAALLTQERDAALDAAEEARREARREREFLLREQDRFIQLLLEEHEAELQQLRRSLSPRPLAASDAEVSNFGTTAQSAVQVASADSHAPIAIAEKSASAEAGSADAAPATVVGIAPAFGEEPAESRRSSPPGEFFSGAALARQALANAVGNEIRTVPLPEKKPGEGDTGPEARAEDDRGHERAPTYPPAPAVLDLDSLAAEIDGNSERPPPIRRIGVAELKVHLAPARVPTQLFDTLVSPIGELDPNRKG